MAEENMTEEQKIEYTKRFFSTLTIMQHNFERDHPKE
jgi:hypothetical protein